MLTETMNTQGRLEVARGIWIDVPRLELSARVRAALAWPEKVPAYEWVETYRYLTKTAIPGPWRNRNAPYLVGMLHLANCPGVEWLTVQKAVQLGVSEAGRCMMGYWAHLDPEPMGLALPNKEKGEQIVKNDVIPLFKKEFARHKELRALLSPRLQDMKKGEIKLDNAFLLYLMWAGSPASMAANPMKRAVMDEVNKFPAWSGDDADPVSLIEKRTRTYPDRLLWLISSPTGPEGQITVHFEQAHVKLYFLIACPQCGCRQRLIFGEGGPHGVKFSEKCREMRKRGEHEAAGAQAMRPGEVWYQCCNEKCGAKLDERAKRQAVRAGKWGTVGEDLLRGEVQGEGTVQEMWDGGPIADVMQVKRFPTGTRVGMQISSLCCCWESWTLAHVAAEFLQAQTLAQRFAFRTSTLGEAWAQSVERIDVDVLDARTAEATLPEGVVPRWAARLIATVDTQADHFWMVIRAWGPGLRSARVWHGKVDSFDAIEQWAWKTPWKNEDPRLPARICDKVLIDTGGTKKWGEEEFSDAPLPSRVMDVYAWVLKKGDSVAAIKGDARPEPGVYLRKGKGEFVHDREKRPVLLWLLDVHHFQDQLADLMKQRVAVVDYATGEVLKTVTEVNGVQTGGVPAWDLNTRNDGEYNRHMAAMHKVSEREGGKGKMVLRWRPKREGMRLDLRACEGYQVAGAFMTGVHLLPDLGTYLAAVEAELVQKQEARSQKQEERRYATSDGRAFVASQR